MSNVIYLDIYKGWEGHKFQEEVMECEARFITIVAGRRGGKTNVSARKFWDLIIRDLENYKGNYIKPRNIRELKAHPPKLLYFAVAPTYELSRIQQKELLKTIPREFIIHMEYFSQGVKRIWLRGYAVIEFKSAQIPQKLVGDSVNGMWLDETAKMKAETWDYVGPALMDNLGSFCLFSTTPESMNWFYTKIVRNGQHRDFGGDPEDFKNHPDWYNIYWTSLDNDKAPGLIEQVLEQQKVLPPNIFDREYRARFDSYKGQVYPILSASVHRVSNSEIQTMRKKGKFKNYYIFKDFGFDHWGVALLVGETYDKKMYVIEERYRRGIPFYRSSSGGENWEDILLELILEYKPKMLICDNAEPGAIAVYDEAFFKHDVEVVPADKRGGSVNEGIQVVSLFLHYVHNETTPMLYMNKDCKELYRQMASYQWKANGSGKPLDSDDDGPDALRYGLYYLYLEIYRQAKLEIDNDNIQAFNLFG